MRKKTIEVEIMIPNDKDYVNHTVQKDGNIYKIIPSFKDIYKPKEGEFLQWIDNKSVIWEGIFKGINYNGDFIFYVYKRKNSTTLYTDNNPWNEYFIFELAPLSLLDCKDLLSVMHFYNKDWDAENKKVVDYKWIPKDGDQLYYPAWDTTELKFVVAYIIYYSNIEDHFSFQDTLIDKEMANRTRKEAQELCNKLNEAIKNIR